MALYDELWSGIAVVAAPGVEQAHALDHDWYALLIFALPVLLAALIEAPLAVLSDRVSRPRLRSAALLALAGALIVCGAAHNAWLLSLGLALAGAASGVACDTAQAELIAAEHERADRAMSRWIALAAAGDLLAPALVAIALWAGASYRAALTAIALVIAVHALLPLRARLAAHDRPPADAERRSLLPVSLRLAASSPRVWLLLTAAAFCTLLDEIVVALAALRLHQAGWPEPLSAAAISALSAGALVGALACDRLLARVSARTLLLVAGGASLLWLALFVAASEPWLCVASLILLGAFAAPHYALVQAAAYRAAPGSPGVINALSQLLVGLEVALPFAVGVVAARYGIDAALLCLAAQPLVVLAVAPSLGRR